MKIKILCSCLFLMLAQTHAQNLKGVWFSGYNLKIDKDAGVEEFQVDSTYSIEGSVIDFSTTNKFYIKSVGGELTTGNYLQKGDSVFLKLNEFQWKGIVQNERLKLIMIDSADYSLELFYDKLKPSNISNSILKPELLPHTPWSISGENSEMGLTFLPKDTTNILKKERVLVTSISENNTGTSTGYYLLDSYKNYYFLYLIGGGEFDEKMLCLTSYSEKMFKGVLFEAGHLNDEILSQIVSFSVEDFLKAPVRAELQLQLKGRYQLQLMNLYEHGYSPSIQTVISYLELLDHNAFKLEEFITEKVKGENILRKTEKKGFWELSASGKYITLKFENMEDCFLTLRKENNKLVLYMSGNPFPDEENLGVELKFKKH